MRLQDGRVRHLRGIAQTVKRFLIGGPRQLLRQRAARMPNEFIHQLRQSLIPPLITQIYRGKVHLPETLQQIHV